MPPDGLIATIRDIGHVLLMAVPGLAPWVALPLARVVVPEMAHGNWQRKTTLWTVLGAGSLSLYGALAAIGGEIPNTGNVIAMISTIVIGGALYVRWGGTPIADAIDRCNRALLRVSGMLVLACCIAMLINVILRHVFAVGFGWAREMVIYCFAGCFMLGAAGTLGHDGHVRIDVVRRTLPHHWQARLELAGSLAFLLPVMLLILHVYAPQLALAWGAGSGHLETSDEGDGLPLAFAFKTLIPIFAISMAAQGWASAWRASPHTRTHPQTDTPV